MYDSELAPRVNRTAYRTAVTSHVEADPGLFESLPRVATTAAVVASRPADEGTAFYRDLYGEGKSGSSALGLSFVRFEGERGRHGEEPGEFEFMAYGTVWSAGTGSRDVRLEGVGRSFGREATPFVHFHGHASEVDRPALADMLNVYRVSGLVAAAPKRRTALESPSRAYREFKQLAKWLELSQQELADIIGVSRTTVSVSWGKKGKDPRNKETARRVYELHSVVSALHRALSTDLAAWLKRGPMELLKAREYEQFERCADEVIFASAREPRPRLDTAQVPRAPEPVTPAGTLQLKPAGRARSKRLAR
jgi:DNA-binding XRE family transcriptional regulator